MFRRLMNRQFGRFNRQVARCTLCLRPTEQEVIPPEQLVQGHYVCPTCQHNLTPEEITTSLQALGLISLPPPTLSALIQPKTNSMDFDRFRVYQELPFILRVYAKYIEYYTTNNFNANYIYIELTTNTGDIIQLITYDLLLFLPGARIGAVAPRDSFFLAYYVPQTLYNISASGGHGLVLTDQPEEALRYYDVMINPLLEPTYHLINYYIHVASIDVMGSLEEGAVDTIFTFENGLRDRLQVDSLDMNRYDNFTVEEPMDRIHIYRFKEAGNTVIFYVYSNLGYGLTDDLVALDRHLRVARL